MKMTVSDPIMVGQGPTFEEISWGPWQFPTLGRLQDGRIACGIQDEIDSEISYEKERIWFASDDEGSSWKRTDPKMAENQCGLKIPCGDRLAGLMNGPHEVDGIAFPEKPFFSIEGYDDFYLYDSLKMDPVNPPIRKVVPFKRISKGETESHHEEADVSDWPYLVIQKGKGGVYKPFFFGRMRIAPDSSLWYTHYQNGADPYTGKAVPNLSAYYFRSTDNGKSWHLASWLNPDETENAGCFCEQDITWLKNGKALTLLRGSKCYIAFSDDGGYHWGKPEIFDNIGVDPAVVTLKCGATIASYGRPGFFVRACFDPEGRKWEEPVTLIPDVGYINTCSYSDIEVLSDNSALVVYSDFFYPDEKGVGHKTILVRKITVE